MRVALISDVHSNLPALDAVLSDIDRSSVDRIVCLGDLVDLGPQPRDVLDRIRSRRIPSVRGNHDPLADDVLFPGAPPLLRTVLQHNRRALDEDDRRYLRELPASIIVRLSKEEEGGGISEEARPERSAPRLLCVHGSPRSDEEGVVAGLTDAELDDIFRGAPEFDMFACGHTHVQMVRRWRGRTVVNAGSVGCPFERTYLPGERPVVRPWAEYCVVDCRNGRAESLRVDLRRVPFDIGAFRESVINSFGPKDGNLWLENYEGI